MNKDNAKDYLPLVQALADGKVIQEWVYGRAGEKIWADVDIIDCSMKPTRYRIKPEPREFWANRVPDIAEVFQLNGALLFATEEEARRYANPGYVQVRFREVVE